MYNLIYVELHATWVPVDSDVYRHQVYNGHRWSVSHASHEQVERLALLLRGVGSINEKLDAYPASIKVASALPTATVVDRIQDILDKVFG